MTNCVSFIDIIKSSIILNGRTYLFERMIIKVGHKEPEIPINQSININGRASHGLKAYLVVLVENPQPCLDPPKPK